jgi:hypothetical protein
VEHQPGPFPEGQHLPNVPGKEQHRWRRVGVQGVNWPKARPQQCSKVGYPGGLLEVVPWKETLRQRTGEQNEVISVCLALAARWWALYLSPGQGTQ